MQLWTHRSGLGSRSAIAHSHSAFCASVSGTAQLQASIWPGLSMEDVFTEQAVRHAIEALRPTLPIQLR